MPIEMTAALIGLTATVGSVVLSWMLGLGRSERLDPRRLREYLLIRDASLKLDAKQAKDLEFEIAWYTARTIGFPIDYQEKPTSGEQSVALVFAILVVCSTGGSLLGAAWVSESEHRYIYGAGLYLVIVLPWLFGLFVLNPLMHRKRFRRWLDRVQR